MTMANLVGEKGQIKDHIEIRFYPPEHDLSVRGALKKYATRVLSTDDLREARARPGKKRQRKTGAGKAKRVERDAPAFLWS